MFKKSALVVLSLVASLSSVAQAKSVLLVSGDMDGAKFSGFEYQVDQESGLVSLELAFEKIRTCGGVAKSPDFPVLDCARVSKMTVSVPGLVVDQDTNVIVMSGQGEEDGTACAVIKKQKSFFGSKTVIVPTGLCGVRASESSRSSDIFFETQE